MALTLLLNLFKIENKSQCRVLLCSVAGVVLVLLLNSLDFRIISSIYGSLFAIGGFYNVDVAVRDIEITTW